MTSLKSRLPLLLLTLGAILRTVTLGSAALWYDESVTLYRTSLLPFLQTYTAKVDNSGCLLLELLLRPLVALGHGGAVPLLLLRLPSLLAGLGCLALVWLIMRELQFTPTQQAFTALFAACLPGALWIAQDARSYSLLALVFLAGLWYALRGRPLGMAACMGLMIYCHNVGPAYAAAVLCIGLYFYPTKWRLVLLAGLVAALAWLPALLHDVQMSLAVFGIFQPWAVTLTFKWFVNALIQSLWTTRSPAFILAAFLILLVSPGLLYSKAWKCRPRNAVLLAWVVPVGVLVLASVWFFNLIMYRTLMPLVFSLSLFLGWEFGRAVETLHATHLPVYRLALAALWTGLLVVGLARWRPSDRGGQLDRAAAYIRSEWQTGDVLVYETLTAGMPFNFYLSDLPHYTWPYVTHDPLMNEPGLPMLTSADPAAARRVWLIVPRDGLITAAESAQFDAAFPHPAAPLWRIAYLQAAHINVYLVER